MPSRHLSAHAPPFIPRPYAERYPFGATSQPPVGGGQGVPPPAYGSHVPTRAPAPAPTPAHVPGYRPTHPTQHHPQFPANVRVSEPHTQQRNFNTGGSVCEYPPGAISTTLSIHPMPYPSLPDPFYNAQSPQYPQPYSSQFLYQQLQPYGNPAQVNPQSQAQQGPGNIGSENLPPGVPTYNATLAGRRRAHYPFVNNTESAEQYAAEFMQYFGSSIDNLRSLRELAYCCGMSASELPEDIEACKTYLKTVYVNLFDLVDARRRNCVVAQDCIFRSGDQLRQYSLSKGKVCPGDSGQGNPLWKFMLKRWFQEDYYKTDGTRRHRK